MAKKARSRPIVQTAGRRERTKAWEGFQKAYPEESAGRKKDKAPSDLVHQGRWEAFRQGFFVGYEEAGRHFEIGFQAGIREAFEAGYRGGSGFYEEANPDAVKESEERNKEGAFLFGPKNPRVVKEKIAPGEGLEDEDNSQRYADSEEDEAPGTFGDSYRS